MWNPLLHDVLPGNRKTSGNSKQVFCLRSANRPLINVRIFRQKLCILKPRQGTAAQNDRQYCRRRYGGTSCRAYGAVGNGSGLQKVQDNGKIINHYHYRGTFDEQRQWIHWKNTVEQTF